MVVIAGLIKAGSHDFHPAAAEPHRAVEAVGVLLLLRAFASVEAVRPSVCELGLV